MAPVKRRLVKKKTSRRKAKKRARRGPSPGTLHMRMKVDHENVSFVRDCLLAPYKKAKGWDFLKPEERGNVTAIAKALIRNHIVTGTMLITLKNALIELDFQGVIDLPPPLTRRRKKNK